MISNFLTKFFFHTKGFKLAVEINKETSGTKTLKDFKEKMNDEKFKVKLHELKEKVEEFACEFPMPGFDDY